MLQINNESQIPEILSKASELMTHLRILSLNCVETIHKWKENFSHLFLLSNNTFIKQNALFLPYMVEGENYLIKMCRDLDFLTGSKISRYFNFSKNDPFLNRSTIEDAHSGKIVQFISKNLIYRIKLW